MEFKKLFEPRTRGLYPRPYIYYALSIPIELSSRGQKKKLHLTQNRITSTSQLSTFRVRRAFSDLPCIQCLFEQLDDKH